MREDLSTLEIDIEDKDLQKQASAVWISGNLCNWYSDFVKEIRNIHKQKDEIQQQITKISEESKKDE